jgi:hypothetical protein
MKQSLKKIMALSMALTVLVSSHSFAYFEHICTLTNIKTLSFQLETCAGDVIESPPSNTNTIKKSICCDISLKVNQADNAVQQSYNLGFAPFLAHIVYFPDFRFETPNLALAQEPAFNHGDSSPPLLVPIYLLNEQFIL